MNKLFGLLKKLKKKNKEIKKEILDKNKNILTKSNLGFKIGDVRFQVSWQNGCGLNNPTIRVFLK